MHRTIYTAFYQSMVTVNDMLINPILAPPTPAMTCMISSLAPQSFLPSGGTALQVTKWPLIKGAGVICMTYMNSALQKKTYSFW